MAYLNNTDSVCCISPVIANPTGPDLCSHCFKLDPKTQPERIEPRYQTSSPLLVEQLKRDANEPKLPIPEPKLHWTKQLRQDNERLKNALEYLKFQLRFIPQSRLDKYATAGDGTSAMAYRKCAREVDTRCLGAICVSQEILDGESVWDDKLDCFVD